MKLSIIAEGGGMRGAYALGAIDALYSYFGLKEVDFATGSSASIATLAYYVAGQFYPGYYIWPNELPNYRFLSFRNILNGYPFLNVDYVIDEIFKKRIPLNENKVKESKTKLIIPLTNFETGKAEYFDNRTKFDFFEILRAVMAAPFIYNKSIRINGSEYFDGSFGDPLPIDLPGIKDSRKIIILTKPRNNDMSTINISDNLMLMLFKLKFKSAAYESLKLNSILYQKRLNEIKKLEAKGDIVIYPSKKISRFDNKAESIKNSIEQGYKDAVSNQNLIRLMKKLKTKEKYKV